MLCSNIINKKFIYTKVNFCKLKFGFLGYSMVPSFTLNALSSGLGHFGVAFNQIEIRHIDTYGAIVNNSKTNITCFVRSSESSAVLDILKKTSKVSYYVGMITHEAYNFKGEFQEVIDLDSDSLNISENYRKNLIDVLSGLGLNTEAVKNRYDEAPDLGIIFKVKKVFIQTPGPEAGKII